MSGARSFYQAKKTTPQLLVKLKTHFLTWKVILLRSHLLSMNRARSSTAVIVTNSLVPVRNVAIRSRKPMRNRHGIRKTGVIATVMIDAIVNTVIAKSAMETVIVTENVGAVENAAMMKKVLRWRIVKSARSVMEVTIEVNVVKKGTGVADVPRRRNENMIKIARLP